MFIRREILPEDEAEVNINTVDAVYEVTKPLKKLRIENLTRGDEDDSPGLHNNDFNRIVDLSLNCNVSEDAEPDCMIDELRLEQDREQTQRRRERQDRCDAIVEAHIQDREEKRRKSKKYQEEYEADVKARGFYWI